MVGCSGTATAFPLERAATREVVAAGLPQPDSAGCMGGDQGFGGRSNPQSGSGQLPGESRPLSTVQTPHKRLVRFRLPSRRQGGRRILVPRNRALVSVERRDRSDDQAQPVKDELHR
jgi:hypothetical protein